MRNHLMIWALLLLGACTTSESSPTPDPEAGNAISFGIAQQESGRASTLIGSTDQADFRAQPFAVYGDWIDPKNSARTEVFHDVEVSYQPQQGNSPSGWNYSPVQYWESTGEYNFRAYWPASAHVLGTASAQTLALEYSMLTQNEDLMVAYNHVPTKNNGEPVALQFHHTLAAVAVKFHTLNSGMTCRVKEFFFTSLNYIGALPYYSTDTTPDVTESWIYAEGSRSYVDPDNIFLSERLRPWSDPEGRTLTTSPDDYPEEFDLFLPQSLVVGAGTPPPSITFTVDIEWDSTDTVSTTIALPTTNSKGEEMVWRAGKKYIYVITVEADRFDIEVKTCEWDKVDAVIGDIRF